VDNTSNNSRIVKPLIGDLNNNITLQKLAFYIYQ
jgi:hypothetical protein